MRKQQHSIIPAFKLATDINVKWPPEEEGTRGRNESAIKCDLFVCHVLVAPHRCDVFICWHFSSPQLSQSFRPLNDMPRGLLSQSVSVSFFLLLLLLLFFFFLRANWKMYKEQVDENIPIMVSKNRKLDWSTTIKRGEVFSEWSIVVLGWSKNRKREKKGGGFMEHFVEERKEDEDKEKEGEQQRTDKMPRGHREEGEQRRCCRSLAPELTAAVSPLSSHHSSSGYCSSAWASRRPLVSTARLLMSRSCYTHTHTHKNSYSSPLIVGLPLWSAHTHSHLQADWHTHTHLHTHTHTHTHTCTCTHTHRGMCTHVRLTIRAKNNMYTVAENVKHARAQTGLNVCVCVLIKNKSWRPHTLTHTHTHTHTHTENKTGLGNVKKPESRSDEEFETATPNTVVLLGGVSIREGRILSDEGSGRGGAVMSRSADKDTVASDGRHTQSSLCILFHQLVLSSPSSDRRRRTCAPVELLRGVNMTGAASLISGFSGRPPVSFLAAGSLVSLFWMISGGGAKCSNYHLQRFQ